MAMIELGGNIQMHGFESLDQADVLIAKKLVGGYVRRICDEIEGCQGTRIHLEPHPQGFAVTAAIVAADAQETAAQANGSNVFMTIDASMKSLLKELRVELERK